MSHYTVLVINTKGEHDVENQLEPFNENTEVDSYENPVSKENIDRFVSYYREKLGESISGLSPKDLYELKGEDWNGGSWEFKENGEVVEHSTYNPDSKWDWYQIGGRWAGALKLKEETSEEYEIDPGFSWGWNEASKLAVISQKKVDQARVCDIDWEGMRDPDSFESACRFWEIHVDGEDPKDEKDKELIKFTFYKPEYYKEVYGDKITYARCRTSFTTYAVLKDGEWIAPGEMGWFGMSSEGADEKRNWELDFYDLFIKDLPPNALLTVVDCHI
jgi:hypothetical protein